MSWPLVKPRLGEEHLLEIGDGELPSLDRRPGGRRHHSLVHGAHGSIYRAAAVLTPRRLRRATCRGAGPARSGGAAGRPSSIRRTRPLRPARGARSAPWPLHAAGRTETNGLSGVASGSQIVEEGVAGVGAEAGPDLADVAQPAVVGDPEQQRAEAVLPLAPPVGPGADDDLLRAEGLDLGPVGVAPTRSIRRGASLGDDALEAVLHGGGEDVLTRDVTERRPSW